jgi:hypothetical protein
MHGSRSKIPSKNLVSQRCAEGFNFGVIELMYQARSPWNKFEQLYLNTEQIRPKTSDAAIKCDDFRNAVLTNCAECKNQNENTEYRQ